MAGTGGSFISWKELGVSPEAGREFALRYGFHPASAHDEVMDALNQIMGRLIDVELRLNQVLKSAPENYATAPNSPPNLTK